LHFFLTLVANALNGRQAFFALQLVVALFAHPLHRPLFFSRTGGTHALNRRRWFITAADRHSHHVIGDTIRLLLKLITRSVHSQLRLDGTSAQHVLHRMVTDGSLHRRGGLGRTRSAE